MQQLKNKFWSRNLAGGMVMQSAAPMATLVTEHRESEAQYSRIIEANTAPTSWDETPTGALINIILRDYLHLRGSARHAMRAYLSARARPLTLEQGEELLHYVLCRRERVDYRWVISHLFSVEHWDCLFDMTCGSRADLDESEKKRQIALAVPPEARMKLQRGNKKERSIQAQMELLQATKSHVQATQAGFVKVDTGFSALQSAIDELQECCAAMKRRLGECDPDDSTSEDQKDQDQEQQKQSGAGADASSLPEPVSA